MPDRRGGDGMPPDGSRVFGGRYEVVAKLGEGGMGEVWMVRDLADDRRPMAFKWLKGRREHLSWFKHEFQLLSRLSHPGLVRVFDFGFVREQGEARFYYTCELVEDAVDLMEATRGPGGVSDTDALLDLVGQVLSALSYVHGRGLIHHDIKPQNILVARREDEGGGRRSVVKLTDFGLSAKARAGTGGGVRGTIHYLAPELVREESVDRRADLYSLGVTLYQVLTGRLPFTATRAVDVLRAHLAEWPEAPSTVEPSIPEAWSKLVLRLLEKDPADRCSDAGQVWSELCRGLGRSDEERSFGAFTGSLLAGRFVGRRAALMRLRDSLPERDSGAHFLRIVGPAGIGKTRLLRELKVYAQFHDRPFVMASCPPDGEAGIGALDRVLQLLLLQAVDGESGERMAALAEDELASLQVVFPGVVEALPGLRSLPVHGHEADRAEHLDRIARLVLRSSMVRPLTLVLDDLHWAGDLTRRFLGALARNIAAYRGRRAPALTVILSGRSPEESGQEPIVKPGPGCEVAALQLSSLSESETAELVASMIAVETPDPVIVRRIHEVTEGLPYFVEELVRAFLEEGVFCLHEGLAPGLRAERLEWPESLRAVLGERLSRMPEGPRAVTEALAIHGSPVSLEVLAATTCLPRSDVLSGLHHLKRREMVTESGGAGLRYTLRHRRLGEAVLRTLGASRRKALHAMAGLALEETLPDPEQRRPWFETLARHFDRAALAKKAFLYYRHAARHAEKHHRLAEAAELLRRALELLRAGAGALDDPSAGEAPLLLTLGAILHRMGRSAEAVTRFRAVVELGEDTTGLEIQLQGLRQLAVAQLKRGDYEGASESLRRALGRAGRSHPEERSRALGTLAQLSLWRGDYLSACAVAREVLAHPAGVRRRRHCRNILCVAESWLGQPRRAVEHLRASLALIREEGPSGSPAEREVVLRAGVDVSELEQALERTEGPVAPQGDGYGLILNFSEVGIALDLLGRREAARRFADEAVRVYRRLGNRQLEAAALNNRGVYERLSGDLAGALASLEQALAITEGSDDPHGGGLALLNLSLLQLGLGELVEAERRARRVLELARDAGIPWLQGQAYRALGRILRLLDRDAEAEPALKRAEGAFRMLRNRRNLVAVLLDRAELELETDLLAATALLESARRLGVDASGEEGLRLRVLSALCGPGGEDTRSAGLEDAAYEAAGAGLVELERDLCFQLGEARERLGASWLASEAWERALTLDRRCGEGLAESVAASYGRHPGLARGRRRAREGLARLGSEPL